MKFRTDFVTNSSSSGFVVVTVTTKSGKELSGGFDSEGDRVYEGSFYVDKEFFEELTDGAEIISEMKEWFEDILDFENHGDIDSVYGCKENAEISQLRKEDIKEIIFSSETCFEEVDEQYESEISYNFETKKYNCREYSRAGDEEHEDFDDGEYDDEDFDEEDHDDAEGNDGDFKKSDGVLTEYVGEEETVVIPYGVTSIGDSAFCGCEKLTSITIPDSVTSIGDYAFYNCSSLTSVTIPDSVISIGASAFRDCSSLTSITIPDSVTSIGNWEFEGCENLTSIIIPNSVTSIGDSAFFECENLTNITIPDSVTSIGDSAFCGCENLNSITIPDSVTSIGDYAFSWCSSLTSITIPDSITSIGENTFDECYDLVIHTPAGSFAEKYAKENGLKFDNKSAAKVQTKNS